MKKERAGTKIQELQLKQEANGEQEMFIDPMMRHMQAQNEQNRGSSIFFEETYFS